MMAKNPMKAHFFLMEVSPDSVASQPYIHAVIQRPKFLPSPHCRSLVLGGLVKRASGKGKTTWKRHV